MRKYTDDEILDEMQRVAGNVEGQMSYREFIEHGNISLDPIKRAFGDWNTAKVEAGLPIYEHTDGPSGEDWYNQTRAESSCRFCPEDDDICLQFHHVNPDEKEGRVGTMAYHGYSADRLKEEADRCIIVCANCHQRLHHGDLTLPPDPSS